MAATRFTRARTVSIAALTNYTLDYNVPEGKELVITELFANTSLSLVLIELLYSDDNGSTWINPWDEGSDHLLKIYLGAGIPASGSPQYTYFRGGNNILVRLKITNLHPSSTAAVNFLIKGLERDVE